MVHVGLFMMAIVPPKSARLTSVPRQLGERVHYMDLPFTVPGRTTRAAPAPVRRVHRRTPRRTEKALVFNMPSIPDIALPATEPIPELFSAKLVDTLWQGDQPGGLTDALARGTQAAPTNGTDDNDNQTYIESTVDKSAIPLPENPKPAYPPDLERRAVEARFSVFFVVDTAGRVDMETVEVPTSVNEQFQRAVRTVLVQWQFFPAQRRGHSVRQLMEQPVVFRMVRREDRRR
jgi:TonB family protein